MVPNTSTSGWCVARAGSRKRAVARSFTGGWRGSALFNAMAKYEVVQIRDLADPYWTLMRLDPPEWLRSEYHFETKSEADREAKRLTALKDEADL